MVKLWKLSFLLSIFLYLFIFYIYFNELHFFPGGGNGNPLQDSCLENPHGKRSLAGYSPWGRKQSDTTEPLSTYFFQKKKLYVTVSKTYLFLFPGLKTFFFHISFCHLIFQTVLNNILKFPCNHKVLSVLGGLAHAFFFFFFFLLKIYFRIAFKLTENCKKQDKPKHNHFPLLLTSYISLVHLLQLLNQY